MKTAFPPLLSTRHAIPALWQDVNSQLSKGEIILAHLELDLDLSLHFVPGIIILTNLRLLTRSRTETVWQNWSCHLADLALKHHDHAGVGTLELHDATSRLASWRYTLAQNPDALALLTQFDRLRQEIVTGVKVPVAEQDEESEDEADAETDGVAEEQAPSTASLFRLWRFAKPYRGQLLAGFLLMLASTAATLIPPYMTMPLMDNVLIPYQNGAPLDTALVSLYLGGLFGAALVACRCNISAANAPAI